MVESCESFANLGFPSKHRPIIHAKMKNSCPITAFHHYYSLMAAQHSKLDFPATS